MLDFPWLGAHCLLFPSLNPISQMCCKGSRWHGQAGWGHWGTWLGAGLGQGQHTQLQLSRESTCRVGQNPHLLKALFWSKVGLLAEGSLICPSLTIVLKMFVMEGEVSNSSSRAPSLSNKSCPLLQKWLLAFPGTTAPLHQEALWFSLGSAATLVVGDLTVVSAPING